MEDLPIELMATILFMSGNQAALQTAPLEAGMAIGAAQIQGSLGAWIRSLNPYTVLVADGTTIMQVMVVEPVGVKGFIHACVGMALWRGSACASR